MKIVDNLNSNHNVSIKSLITVGDHLILVSPFLTTDFDEFIHDTAELGIKKITLVTTLKDCTPDLIKKADSLRSLFFACQENNIDYEIRLDDKLHGKIYIALENGIPKRGIITSANLTSNGLKYNHEWGVEIDDSDAIQKVIDDVFSVSTSPLSLKELNDIYSVVDEYRQQNPQEKEQKLDIKIGHIFKSKLPVKIVEKVVDKYKEFPTGTKFFIKPVGSSDDPIDETWVFNPKVHEMHFSKRRPSAVRPGDILICYAVGTTKLLGYFEVLDEPFKLPDNTLRWPWAVNISNQCPDYCLKWWKVDNTLSNLMVSYGSGKELTYVGGTSLGALNFGADKIRLNDDFAHYLIGIIEQEVKK